MRPDGTIETIAGTGVSGFAGDGGPATSALLNFPTSLAYDSAGNLCFADMRNYRIRCIDIAGNINTVAGDGMPPLLDDAETAGHISPQFLIIDQNGNINFSAPI
jgi:hypothetical protein